MASAAVASPAPVAFGSAEGLMALLQEEDVQLQVRPRILGPTGPSHSEANTGSCGACSCRDGVQTHALQRLWEVVDYCWAEIADAISEIEELSENEDFPQREVAAAVASKVCWHSHDSAPPLPITRNRLAVGGWSTCSVAAPILNTFSAPPPLCVCSATTIWSSTTMLSSSLSVRFGAAARICPPPV